MKQPLWSILIPTVVTRPEQFKRLADILAPQVAKYNGDIEVLVHWNNFEKGIGPVRQQLIEGAKGEYVNFIDDDDAVTDDYCDSIFPLLDGVDYIGFRVAFYQNNQKQKPVIHSLTCEKWTDTGEGFYRRVTMINPIKRSLALQSRVGEGDYKNGIPEERVYADNLDKITKTEHFLDKEVHIYTPTDDHAWNKFEGAEGDFKRPELPKYFRFHKDSTK
jgi:hypothetical protein